MHKMHKDMKIKFTGDADVDFARGMIPHHQAAIEMALVMREHGRDMKLRDLAWNIIRSQRQEIKQIHETIITEMKPKDFDQYIKYMKRNNVEVIPSINKSNQLQGFRFEYKGHNLKGSEVHRSMSMGKIAERIGFDKTVAQKIRKDNSLNLLGKTVGVSPNLAMAIAKKAIKMVIKKTIGLGMEI